MQSTMLIDLVLSAPVERPFNVSVLERKFTALFANGPYASTVNFVAANHDMWEQADTLNGRAGHRSLVSRRAPEVAARFRRYEDPVLSKTIVVQDWEECSRLLNEARGVFYHNEVADLVGISAVHMAIKYSMPTFLLEQLVEYHDLSTNCSPRCVSVPSMLAFIRREQVVSISASSIEMLFRKGLRINGPNPTSGPAIWLDFLFDVHCYGRDDFVTAFLNQSLLNENVDLINSRRTFEQLPLWLALSAIPRADPGADRIDAFRFLAFLLRNGANTHMRGEIADRLSGAPRYGTFFAFASKLAKSTSEPQAVSEAVEFVMECQSLVKMCAPRALVRFRNKRALGMLPREILILVKVLLHGR